jgi:7-carboxy-7-deazaguanine synthase
MFGKNVLARRETHLLGMHLSVNSIFHTIQGEGPYAGIPAVFIRLAGCNLRCFFCDTEFEEYEILSLPDIYNRIDKLLFNESQPGKNNTNLIVITGGEPMRQNIIPLLNMLTHSPLHYHVQIETAGTLWQESEEDMAALMSEGNITIVCSPKTGSVHPLVELHCSHFKYIIRDGELSSSDGLPIRSTQNEHVPLVLYRPRDNRATIWVQPCAEYFDPKTENICKTKRNMDACVQVALRYGYRVSLQQHKILNVD